MPSEVREHQDMDAEITMTASTVQRLAEAGQDQYLSEETRSFVLGVVREILLHPGAVLDLGCGTGTWSRDLARLGHRVVGVDLSADAIAFARKCEAQSERQPIDYRVADVAEMDYGVLPQVDLVFVGGLFHHLTRPQSRKVARGCLRALKRGGHILCVEWNRLSLRACYASAFRNALGARTSSNERPISPKQLRRLLEETGFHFRRWVRFTLRCKPHPAGKLPLTGVGNLLSRAARKIVIAPADRLLSAFWKLSPDGPGNDTHFTLVMDKQ